MKNFISYSSSASINGIETIFFGDVYRILNSKEVNYSALIIELINSEVEEGLKNDIYRITIVDKLLEDEANLLDIYENSSRQLSDFINYLSEEYEVVNDYTINYISQDFSDHLAGLYTELTIQNLKYQCRYDEN